MHHKYTFPIVFLFAITLPNIAFSQINDTLKSICTEIKVDRDNSDPNFSYLIRSRDHIIQVDNDTLFVEIFEIDSLKGSVDPRDHQPRHYAYKANLREIEEIKFVCTVTEQYGFNYIAAHIEINALRLYQLFENTIDHSQTIKTDHINIPVIRHRDTVHYKKIVSILNDYVNPENNYIDPSCEVIAIKIPNGREEKIDAIELGNLMEPIKLNGTVNREEELFRILNKYLVRQNIIKFYGTIVITDTDEFEYLESYQNIMYNIYKSLDSLSFSQQSMQRTAHLTITDKHIKKFRKILKKQNWETGKCNNTKVNAYFDFSIENPKYKIPEDEK